MNQATLILFPNRFQISGPYELAAMTMQIVNNKALNNEELKFQIENLWSNWYVLCAVSGKSVTLDVLKYWDVDRQEIYASPDLVPARFWHLPHDPRPELRDYWMKRDMKRIPDERTE